MCVMCVMWLKPFGHQKTRKKRPSFSALGKNQAAMGQVSDNAAMGHVSKEMQPVALRSIKKVVRTGFADHFMFVPIRAHWLCLIHVNPVFFWEYAGNTSMFWHVLAPNFTPSHII